MMRTHIPRGAPKKTLSDLIGHFSHLSLNSPPHEYPPTSLTLPHLPQEIVDHIFLVLVKICLLPGEIFLNVDGRLLSQEEYKDHESAREFRRPNPQFLLALNKKSLQLAKEFLYSRNTWVLPKGRLERSIPGYFRHFHPLCTFRIRSVAFALTWKDAGWIPKNGYATHVPLRAGEPADEKWLRRLDNHLSNTRLDHRFWLGDLVGVWFAKMEALRALTNLEHVPLNLSEAHDTKGRSLRFNLLRIMGIKEIPVHLRLSSFEGKGGKALQKKLLKRVTESGALIKPCHFCTIKRQDESLRFLRCVQSTGPLGKRKREGIETLLYPGHGNMGGGQVKQWATTTDGGLGARCTSPDPAAREDGDKRCKVEWDLGLGGQHEGFA